MATELLIGELAKQFGISSKTIRWYESEGLLPEASRTSGGYRQYSIEHIQQLDFLRKAFGIGFSSKEIKAILAVRAHGKQPCDLVLDLLDEKLGGIKAQIEELKRLEQELTSLQEEWSEKVIDGRLDSNKVCTCIEESKRSEGGYKNAK